MARDEGGGNDNALEEYKGCKGCGHLLVTAIATPLIVGILWSFELWWTHALAIAFALLAMASIVAASIGPYIIDLVNWLSRDE